MITEIGIVAGEIWHLLEVEKRVLLSQLVESIDHPREIVLMSVGWLAREGHIRLEQGGGDYTVSLR